MRVGFVGLSHLGIVSLAAIASKGHQIVGFDEREPLVQLLCSGRLPLFEPGLQALWDSVKPQLSFSTSADSLRGCEIVYVALDVPTNSAGISDLGPIEAALEIALTNADRCSTVVLLSQVPPGFCFRFLGEFEQKHGGGRPTFYYQVETLIFGRALERALHPERFIVGCQGEACQLTPEFSALLQDFDCPVLPMRIESAELTKVSINAYLVSSVVLSNVLAELATLCGADWSEVEAALRLDARIGPAAYLKPGLGIAGGNLERDLATIAAVGNRLGSDVSLLRAWDALLDYYRDWAVRQLNRYVYCQGEAVTVAIWGLAYKQDTDSTKNSPSIALIQALADRQFVAYDPQAKAEEQANLRQVSSALEACNGAAALAILTPWEEFRGADLKQVASALSGRVVIDPFRVLDAKIAREVGLRVICLGVDHGDPDLSLIGVIQ